jgi:O-antigen/teichoic acid export membrane protein
MKGALARASLFTAVVLGLRMTTQGALLILLTRLLKPYFYGSYAAAASLGVILGALSSLGAGYVLMSRATKRAEEVAELWRYAWPLTVTLGCALVPLYGIVCTLAVHDRAIPLHVLLIIGACELLLTPFTTLSSFVLQAREKVPLSQVVQWLPSALRVIAALACFMLHPQSDSSLLFDVAASQFVASLLGAIIGIWVTSRHAPLNWKPRIPNKEELKVGSSYAAMVVVAYNPSEMDKIAAVSAVGAYDAGLYTASSRVMNALIMPVIAMILAAQPRLFRHAHVTAGESRPLIRLMGLLTFAWGLLCSFTMVLGSHFLPMLLGSAYLETAALLAWMAATAPFLSLRVAAGNILAALGGPMERLAFELGGIVLLLVSMFTLAPLLGTKGVVAANFFAETAMACAGWLMIYSRMKIRSGQQDNQL